MMISFRPATDRFAAPIARSAGALPRKTNFIVRASAGAALLLLAAPAWTQTAPDLGATSPFAIVSETFTNTTPGTVVDGDVCFTTGPMVAPTVNGDTFTPCPPQTGIDQDAARADLVAQPCTSIGAAVALDTISIGGSPPGEFPPGCYSSTGAMSITTGATLTLSGNGVYIFRPGGALDSGANSSVITADGACADNVFWAPEGGTTIGANSAFVGTVFRGTAAGLSITLGDSASLEGRALAFGSTVTTDNNAIAVPDQCPGTIIVEKRTNPPGSLQSFTFTGDAAGDLTDGEQIVVDNLAPGNYSSTESVPAGWELTNIICNDADSTGDIGTATANFMLDAGETVTCVFINTEIGATDGTVTILKQADPPDTGQSFDFSGDLGNFSLRHGEFIVEARLPGTYAVSETVPPGWQLDSATCDDGSPVSAIEVEAGENVTCVFENSELAVADGTITILKQADPPDTGQSFDFSGDLGNFSLRHGEFIVETRPPGIYAVSETVPPGWQLDSATCDDGSPVSAIDLQAGESVTCTFTNSQRAAALSVPIFSQGGIALFILMMMLLAVVFPRRH